MRISYWSSDVCSSDLLSSLTRTIHPGELRAMRWVLLVLFVLLAGCGGGRAPTPQPRPQTDIRQCLMGLERAGVRYRSLPDRHFGGGCQATGSVQLLAVGVPVTKLTAPPCPMAAG